LRLVVAISGASGIELAKRFLKHLPKRVESIVVVSDNAKLVISKEGIDQIHYDKDLAANVASGSYKCDAMIILPCSTNTLAKIANGIADNLTTRAASVMIKERRKLILCIREMPLSTIALENMLKLSTLNVIIAPPIIAYYSKPKSLEDMEDFLVGKLYDLLGIEHNLFKRWGE
jgi:4-hydroxy-3-polyprenylbenzoate decarboxylase